MSLGNNTEQTGGAAAGECEIKRNEEDKDLLLLSSPENSSPGSGMSSHAKDRALKVESPLRTSVKEQDGGQQTRQSCRPTRFPAACLHHPVCSDRIQLRDEVRKTNTEDTSYTGSPIERLMAAERVEAGEV